MNYTNANLPFPISPALRSPFWFTHVRQPGCNLLGSHENAHRLLALFAALTITFALHGHAQIAPSELVAPKLEISGGNLNFTVQPSIVGRSYQLQYSDSMAAGTWMDVETARAGDGGNLLISIPYESASQRGFYRLLLTAVSATPDGFALIPAGSFIMGDRSSPRVGASDELPVHSVYVSAFYMAKYEVTKSLWDEVRTWGLANGYTNLSAGAGKATNHPVQAVTWYDMLKWCNARSEKELLTPCYMVSGLIYRANPGIPVCNWSANGYRLPSEAEWEKAARGGLDAANFPWGNTIAHSQANYFAHPGGYPYDISLTSLYHPTYYTGATPYTSPVGSFAPNGYGLYDMAGNVWERCWDWYGSYTSDSQTDPRGAASGAIRVYRGGAWYNDAIYSRVAARGHYADSTTADDGIGFRVARSSAP
jgi:sulfatase modifying factor 1